ncbi:MULTISPECIES: lipid droplet-associated protein [unclassified Actinopolyspora]|uniref:lipid droplet-associated protein n=1 Tax=unclassified Actinopolyspora TaxID=2639451 RepID=UPI0013F5E3E0|nr:MULTISPECIES: lipid droplet-associated protein [unclassified Actinopolyspora]NHD17875.1 lipid droplet-associated protein [Actinopolyspora sp. BKK2]NHE77748.1 lipid droplet-associated protein [Actinopolyspora sp. BKK1]
MRSFPLPIRVAAGLASTAVEQTRRLPDCLIGLPVTVTSQALQLTMRVQQQVTELAIKGDDLLAELRQPEQQPEWARFDEDERTERAQPPAASSEHPAGETVDAAEAGPATGGGRTAPTGEDDVSDLLPDYEEMTLPQLRGKLRRLSLSELHRLLRYERAHSRRPDFLQMLSNRINNLGGSDAADE